MRHETDGIVLKGVEFGEADLIATFVTPDRGLLSAFAKSPRKIRSRFGASLEPLTHSRIGVLGREGASLPRLVRSDIIHPFAGLREDFRVLVRIAGLVKLFERLSSPGEARPQKFGLLLATLHSMESTGKISLLSVVFVTKFLWMSGYGPRLDACARCHTCLPEGAPRTFFPDEGAALCRACGGSEGGVLPVSRELASFFRRARNLRLAELVREENVSALWEEARELLDAHLARIDATGGSAHGFRTRC